MFRRNVFVVVVLLGLILSAAFTSWTQDTSGAGKSSSLSGKSFPPDFTKYTRPSIPGDVIAKPKGSTVLFQPVEVPNSAGGEPDIAINPTNLKQITVHAGFGGWNGNAPNEISTDGGLTWNQIFQIPPPPGAPNTAGCPCDITHDWGMDGNLYGSYLTGNTDVFSASTATQAGTFSYFLIGPNAQLTDFNGTLGGADQPQLKTGPDPFTLPQTDTFVGYSDFGVSPPNERVSASFGTSPPDYTSDNVAGVSTFSAGCVINPGNRVATDPRTGAVYSFYQTCTASTAFNMTIGYKLNRSLDGDTTWTLNGLSNGILVSTNNTVQAFAAKFGTVNALFGGIDDVAVNPTTGDVFVVYGGDNGTTDPTTGHDGNALFVRRITFDNSSPTKASVGPQVQISGVGAEAALPAIAVAANGTVGVLYTSFDQFSVDGFPIFTAHFTSSTDGGATFTDQTILTFLSVAKASGVPTDKQRVLGDYQQMKVVNDPPPSNAGSTFYGVFTGNGAALTPTEAANNDAIFFSVLAAPQINLNPNPVAIGPVCEGSTSQSQLEVADTGSDPLQITSITRTSGSTDITLATGPTFPVNISPDANFNFTFSCTPTTVGLKTANFNVASNDPANPNTTVTVTCSTASGTLDVTGSGAFGTASCSGATPPQTLTLDNVGACNLIVTSAMISCADFTLVNPPTFPLTISPDSGVGLTVAFTPTSAGPKSCTLTITSNTGGTPGTTTVVNLTGNTALGSTELTFPTGLTFPPTVIQQSAACSASLGIPVTNSGTCPVQITAVGLTQGSSPADYSLTGLPGLPVNVPAGGQLGAGDLDVVFAPFTLARTSTGTVDVTFVNDPITMTTATTHVPFCGEAVRRGMRILVTQGGVPVSTVKRIELQYAFGPEQPDGDFHTIRTIKHASLQTVTGTAPCPSFEFHQEFGGASDTFQLKDGTYRVKVFLSGVKKSKIVRVNMDECTFTQDVVVAF